MGFRTENDNLRKIIMAALITAAVLCIAGCGSSSGTKVPEKEKTPVATESKGTDAAPASGVKAETLDTYGYITGDDVIMRSEPSTAGEQIGLFSKNKELKVLAKYTCDDKNAAILNVNIEVTQNGKKNTFQRGHALQILEEMPDGGYRCKIPVGGTEVTAVIPKKMVGKLYGQVWYQVEADGKQGYVFGDYVQIKPAKTLQVIVQKDMPGTLKRYNGSWYDENGQYAYSIDSTACTFTMGGTTYKITEIASNSNDSGIGEYVFKLSDNGTVKTMKVYADIRGETLFMAFDNNKFLKYQNTKEVKYFESVGGVYIGMLKSQVEKLHGVPDGPNGTYTKDGWQIKYYGDRVVTITLFKNGTCHFDKSGLTAKNTLEDLKKAYNNARVSHMDGGLIISNYGEQVFFEGDKIIFGKP